MKPQIPLKIYLKRQFIHILISFTVIFLWIFIGTLGYHYIADLSWIDSFYNASMIGSGMGPINDLDSDSGKIFASLYAVFSGIIFITSIGIVFTPIAHRIFRAMDME